MNSRFALSLLLGVFLILALAYSVVIPLGEASDEVPHFAYIQTLTLERQMPKPEGQVAGESHQPPLWYILSAAVTGWIPQRGYQVIANPDFAFDDRHIPNLLVHDARENFPYRDGALAWHLARLVSIALGAVTIGATWALAREIFPDNAIIALGAAAFVALLPSFIALSAVANNDNLIIALTALSVLQSARMLHRGVDMRGAAILGIFLGLAALTKLSGFTVWIFSALVFLLAARNTGNWKMLAFGFVLCYALATVIVLPWVTYNFITYGDPFGWSVILESTPIRTEPITWQQIVETTYGLFTSFWGRFGGALHIHMATWVYAILGIFGLVGLSGWVGYANDARAGRIAPGALKVLILLTLFWGGMLIAYARWVLTVLGADQARQLFPGLPLLAIFFVAGLARLFGARAKIALAVMSVCLFGLSIGVLIYLRATFGGI